MPVKRKVLSEEKNFRQARNAGMVAGLFALLPLGPFLFSAARSVGMGAILAASFVPTYGLTYLELRIRFRSEPSDCSFAKICGFSDFLI